MPPTITHHEQRSLTCGEPIELLELVLSASEGPSIVHHSSPLSPHGKPSATVAMILSPLPGTPTITQGFGQNPQIYQQYGYLGHNGFDFGCSEGTIIYAPHDGVATVKDDGNIGYGKYIVIDSSNRRSILGHCSQILVANGQFVHQGVPVAKSGKTGSVTGPHLHWTFKILVNGTVQNKTNGYDGAMDCARVTALWEPKNVRTNATFTNDAKPYLAMTFKPDQVITS